MNNNAQEFLQYIADNEQKLKKNLRKNITYDAELFDDVFQNTVIKIYDTVIKNDLYIENFESYFYTASRFEFINTQNNHRKLKNQICCIDDVKNDIENYIDESKDILERQHEADVKYSHLVDFLIKEFGETDANIFLTYYMQRSAGRTSYKKVAELFNLPIKTATEIIRGIFEFLSKNDEINKIYK